MVSIYSCVIPYRLRGCFAGHAAFCGCLLWAVTTCTLSWGEDGSPLFVMNRDGQGLRKLVEVPGRPFLGSPRCSKDGRWIAFDAWSQEDSTAHVMVMPAKGGTPRDLGLGSMPCWSPEDRQITFFRHGANFGIWVIDLSGEGLERLNENGSSPVWSPNGTQLAFIRLRAPAGLTIFDLRTGQERLLIKRTVDMRHGIDWSPDGHRICGQRLVNAADGSTAPQIYLFDVRTQKITIRLRQETGHRLAWSPDGKSILLFMKGPGDSQFQLYSLNPDSKDPPVKVSGQDDRHANTDPAWSADGTHIIFASGPRK
jgi:dipeptidyl aminopeptidase/acylaminoacyl peptidase